MAPRPVRLLLPQICPVCLHRRHRSLEAHSGRGQDAHISDFSGEATPKRAQVRLLGLCWLPRSSRQDPRDARWLQRNLTERLRRGPHSVRWGWPGEGQGQWHRYSPSSPGRRECVLPRCCADVTAGKDGSAGVRTPGQVPCGATDPRAPWPQHHAEWPLRRPVSHPLWCAGLQEEEAAQLGRREPLPGRPCCPGRRLHCQEPDAQQLWGLPRHNRPPGPRDDGHKPTVTYRGEPGQATGLLSCHGHAFSSPDSDRPPQPATPVSSACFRRGRETLPRALLPDQAMEAGTPRYKHYPDAFV